MPIDEEFLMAHRRFEAEDLGVAEEFLEPTLGSGRTLAVLSRPLRETRNVGWVICHSFGIEQMHLSRLEVVAARSLARAGFPVLRYHGQGYGDSDGRIADIGLTSHLADATDAVALLRDTAEVRHVGVLGGRFGGLVAALVADREALPFMALWNPHTSGKEYMRDFLRSGAIAEMVSGDVAHAGPGNGGAGLRTELKDRGWIDLKGFPLTKQTYDEISSVDLMADLHRFRGSSLLVGVFRSGIPSRSFHRLAERLDELSGTCIESVIDDPRAAQFGQYHYSNAESVKGKEDTQFDLTRRIVAVTTGWAEDVSEPMGSPREGLL